MKKLFDFLTLNPVGVILFSLIGLVLAYLVLVKHYGMSNIHALYGFGLFLAIAAFRIIRTKGGY